MLFKDRWLREPVHIPNHTRSFSHLARSRDNPDTIVEVVKEEMVTQYDIYRRRIDSKRAEKQRWWRGAKV